MRPFILALGRNLGEVFGVFGVFEPTNDGLFVNFLNNNSANFDGLDKLENLLKQIKPPKWPWLVDGTLAAQGKVIFNRSTADGGCQDCHGIQRGKVRFPLVETWATPVLNVGTDTREYDVLGWRAQTGVLKGAFIPFVTDPLQADDLAFNVLVTSVVGSIAQQAVRDNGASTLSAAIAGSQIQLPQGALQFKFEQLPPQLRDLQHAYHIPTTQPPAQPNLSIQGIPLPKPLAAAAPPVQGAYEARVMEGIWAVAPYLHNGSVPTLVELLKPPAERVMQFKVGPAYDTVNVGLAVEQQSSYTFVATNCSQLNSGNNNCGHPFGTTLSDQEKKALLEYLKSL
jgi:hypothetical protein